MHCLSLPVYGALLQQPQLIHSGTGRGTDWRGLGWKQGNHTAGCFRTEVGNSHRDRGWVVVMLVTSNSMLGWAAESHAFL